MPTLNDDEKTPSLHILNYDHDYYYYYYKPRQKNINSDVINQISSSASANRRSRPVSHLVINYIGEKEQSKN